MIYAFLFIIIVVLAEIAVSIHINECLRALFKKDRY